MDINIQMLKKLARHPLQYYFEEGLGIDFEWEERETEFVLSPLELHRLRKGSITLQQLEKEGKLPVGPFAEIAIQKIESEIESYAQALEKLGVRPREIFSIELKATCTAPVQIGKDWIYPALHINETVIQGKIDDLCPQGLLFHGDESLPDLLKAWPLYLIANGLRPTPLLLTKKGKIAELKIFPDALERYVKYAEKALSSPSPLFPRWARGIFKEGQIPDDDDPIVQWAAARNLVPPLWASSWSSYLQEAIRELV